jgi:hypothetical protein
LRILDPRWSRKIAEGGLIHAILFRLSLIRCLFQIYVDRYLHAYAHSKCTYVTWAWLGAAACFPGQGQSKI